MWCRINDECTVLWFLCFVSAHSEINYPSTVLGVQI